MFEGEALGKQLTVIVRDFLARSIATVTTKLDALEQRVAGISAGKDGAPGAPGKDGANGIDGAPGSRGGDGINGKDGAPGDKGDIGERGAAGAPGMAGKDGEAGPKGDPGQSGKDGIDGPPGRDGIAGKDGARGSDGKSVTLDDLRPMFETEMARALLDFERRAGDVLQRAIERIPKPKDGVDGLSIENFTVEHDGDGNVTLRFQRGEVHKEFTIRLPRFKDCGVYRGATEYRQGDAVTWGGSLWLAQKDGQLTKPETPDSGWRLAVKAGRDGKAAEVPPAGPREPVRLK